MDPIEVARDYYGALDGHRYERLTALLASDVRQDRPDLTIEGRDRFVNFMREERPQHETTHAIDRVFETDTDERSVAVQGRLLASDGKCITGFVDVFSFENGKIRHIRTYTDRREGDQSVS